MGKYKTIICDVCDKDTGGEFHYRFIFWGCRTGIKKLYMCCKCMNKLKEFVKKGNEYA